MSIDCPIHFLGKLVISISDTLARKSPKEIGALIAVS